MSLRAAKTIFEMNIHPVKMWIYHDYMKWFRIGRSVRYRSEEDEASSSSYLFSMR
jgi:hypothetical protein